MLILLLIADVAIGDGGLLLRETKMAARLGDDFDPLKLDPHHLGQRLDLSPSSQPDEWYLQLGEDDESCCEEPDYVKPPRWKNGVLRLEQAQGRAFYVCPRNREKKNREVLIVQEGDEFDVTVCGRHWRMARSPSWWERYRRWSRATANRMMGGDYGCEMVAVGCDMKRLAPACRLPFDRTLVLEPRRRPAILPPTVLGSQLDPIFDGEMARVMCVTTSSASP
jgi:hypothetical protein